MNDHRSTRKGVTIRYVRSDKYDIIHEYIPSERLANKLIQRIRDGASTDKQMIKRIDVYKVEYDDPYAIANLIIHSEVLEDSSIALTSNYDKNLHITTIESSSTKNEFRVKFMKELKD